MAFGHGQFSESAETVSELRESVRHPGDLQVWANAFAVLGEITVSFEIKIEWLWIACNRSISKLPCVRCTEAKQHNVDWWQAYVTVVVPSYQAVSRPSSVPPRNNVTGERIERSDTSFFFFTPSQPRRVLTLIGVKVNVLIATASKTFKESLIYYTFKTHFNVCYTREVWKIWIWMSCRDLRGRNWVDRARWVEILSAGEASNATFWHTPGLSK